MGSDWVSVRSDASPPYQGLGTRRVSTRADGWKKTGLQAAAKGSDRRAFSRTGAHAGSMFWRRAAPLSSSLSRWLFGCSRPWACSGGGRVKAAASAAPRRRLGLDARGQEHALAVRWKATRRLTPHGKPWRSSCAAACQEAARWPSALRHRPRPVLAAQPPALRSALNAARSRLVRVLRARDQWPGSSGAFARRLQPGCC